MLSIVALQVCIKAVILCQPVANCLVFVTVESTVTVVL